MPASTVTSKGQVTIPKEVRDALGLAAGVKLWFLSTPEGYVLRAARGSVMELAGSVDYDGPPLSVEEMDVIVGQTAVAEQP